jgi:hypothetical protein
MAPVTVTASTHADLGATTVPVMATEIKLYKSVSGTETEITAVSGGNYLSSTGDTSCIQNLVSTTKTFEVYCTDQSKFAYTNGSSTFTLIYRLQYVVVAGEPSDPKANAP